MLDPSNFETQRHPTVEETIVNNVSTLYRRKKHFLGDLRRLMGTLGYVFIAMAYLRDFSLVLFILRCTLQFLLSEPFPNVGPEFGSTFNIKEGQARFLMRSVLIFNGICLFMHLIFPLPVSLLPSGHYYYGSSSMQFIGESAPCTSWGILAYDVATFFLQLVYHALMCGTDDLEVLSVSIPENSSDEFGSVSLEAVSDGYNGNVTVITIDVLANVKSCFKAPTLPEIAEPVALRLGNRDTLPLLLV